MASSCHHSTETEHGLCLSFLYPLLSRSSIPHFRFCKNLSAPTGEKRAEEERYIPAFLFPPAEYSVRPKKLKAENTAVITAEMLRQYFPLTVNRPKELFSAETAIFGRNKPVSAENAICPTKSEAHIVIRISSRFN